LPELAVRGVSTVFGNPEAEKVLTDVKRAIDFYTTQLGFNVEHQQLPAFATVALGPLKVLLSGPDASGSRLLPAVSGRVPAARTASFFK
jgi:catechol 2,3-dioxygenase-like lactoylglutathione lyase family enzyme